MELTMGQRKAVTAVIARRYEHASKAKKGLILDELCATTGWHRSHARKALRAALAPAMVPARRVRPPIYGPREVAALRTCWIVLGTPAGKRLAPFLPEIVNRLRAQGELDLTDEVAVSLTRMSAATIDRRLAPERARLRARGRSHTKPGSLLKDAIPIRTWAEWDDAVPGFVEIDLVAHEGGNNAGRFASTLTVTDIATGWTENRTVRSKGRQWVFAALLDISACFPFPIKGIDSDNGGEFINYQLLTYCEQHHITFTRSRPGTKNDGAHAEQKNWSVVRQLVGYHRYDTDAEQDLLNQLWAEQSLMTNYFGPQQKLISKVRRGAKITKTYDTATTPHQRAQASPAVTNPAKVTLAATYADLNPAALRRKIQALSFELLVLTKAKRAARMQPPLPARPKRAFSDAATNQATRAS
jgi:hypothetical protein